MSERVSKMWVAQLVFLMATCGSLRVAALAQATPATSQTSPGAQFETVSIHPMRQDDNRPERIENPIKSGYLRAVNVNVKSLMEIAYDIPDLRMIGGPPWLTSERFSLEAKADPSTSEWLASLPTEEAKQLKRKMMVELLTARFKLAVHAEAREMPVYAMVVAKGGSKLGATDPGGDARSAGDQLIQIQPGSNSLEILAYELSWRIGRPVLDRTGLDEKRAVTLRWRGDEETAAESNAPSLFTALQEQLGLKLTSARSPVQVLVIDHAEKPGSDQ